MAVKPKKKSQTVKKVKPIPAEYHMVFTGIREGEERYRILKYILDSKNPDFSRPIPIAKDLTEREANKYLKTL